LNIGLSTGFYKYEDFLSIPLLAHYEVELSQRRVSPFAFVASGYGIVWDKSRGQADVFDKTRGGISFKGGMGYRIKVQNGDIRFGAGYQFQRVIRENTRVTDRFIDDPWWNGGISYQKRNMNRVIFFVGVNF